MRLATQELQHDLNITRGELKKGVLEMPEEARESAEAMRRVVSDQIKALSDLSEIISRHGKTLDLSSPSLGEPRMASPRNIEMQPVAAAVGAESRAWAGVEQRRQQLAVGAAVPAVAVFDRLVVRFIPQWTDANSRLAGVRGGLGAVQPVPLRMRRRWGEPDALFHIQLEPAGRLHVDAGAVAALDLFDFDRGALRLRRSDGRDREHDREQRERARE